MKWRIILVSLSIFLSGGFGYAQEPAELTINGKSLKEFHRDKIEAKGGICSEYSYSQLPKCDRFTGWKTRQGIASNAFDGDLLLERRMKPELLNRLRKWRNLRPPEGAGSTEEWKKVQGMINAASADFSEVYSCSAQYGPYCPAGFALDSAEFSSLSIEVDTFKGQAVGVTYSYDNRSRSDEVTEQSVINAIQQRFPNNQKIKKGVLNAEGTVQLIVIWRGKYSYMIHLGHTPSAVDDWIDFRFNNIADILDEKVPPYYEAAKKAGAIEANKAADIEF